MSSNSISVRNLAKSVVLSGYEALGASSRKLKGAIEKLGYDAVAKISEQEPEVNKAIEIGGEEGLILKDRGAAVNAFTAMFQQLHGVTPEEISSFSKGLDHYLTNGVPDNVITREVDQELIKLTFTPGLNVHTANFLSATNVKSAADKGTTGEESIIINHLKRQGKYFRPDQS